MEGEHIPVRVQVSTCCFADHFRNYTNCSPDYFLMKIEAQLERQKIHWVSLLQMLARDTEGLLVVRKLTVNYFEVKLKMA
jgi:hypothetical protein